MTEPRFFYGWYIVVCCFISQGVRAGLGNQTFGFFIKPLTEELGWSRAVLTGALMTQNIVGATVAPVIGFCIDRYGPRLLMAGGAVCMGASMMLLSQTRHLWQFVLFLGVLGALGFAGLAYSVTSPTIAKWFVRRRGRATGIATGGLNVGVAVFTPLIVFLIDQYGWRSAWLYLGLLPMVLVIPPALLWLRRQPEDMGLLPDGDSAPSTSSSQSGSDQQDAEERTDEVSWTVQDAFRSRTLWLLFVTELVYGTAQGSVIIHRTPFIIDLGFSSATAGVSLVIHSFAALSGKLIWGYLADRVEIRLLLVLVLMGSAAALSALFFVSSPVMLYLGFALPYGLTAGSLTVLGPLIWARYFGRRHLGSIQGFMGPIGLLPGLLGPMFAAFVYDATGSYEFAFACFVALFAIGALMMWWVRRPVASV